MPTNWFNAGLDDNEQTFSNDLVTENDNGGGTVGGVPLEDVTGGQLRDTLNLNQGDAGEAPDSEGDATQGAVVVAPSPSGGSGLSIPSVASIGAAGVALVVGLIALVMGGEEG